MEREKWEKIFSCRFRSDIYWVIMFATLMRELLIDLMWEVKFEEEKINFDRLSTFDSVPWLVSVKSFSWLIDDLIYVKDLVIDPTDYGVCWEIMLGIVMLRDVRMCYLVGWESWDNFWPVLLLLCVLMNEKRWYDIKFVIASLVVKIFNLIILIYTS